MSTSSYMNDCCEETEIHTEAVEFVRAKMPTDERIRASSDLYRLLGDPTRLKILRALCIRELCVCDLSALLDISQSAVSHQLRILRSGDLVRFTRDGRSSRYYLVDDHIRKLLKDGACFRA